MFRAINIVSTHPREDPDESRRAEPSELRDADGVDERQAALTSLPLVIQTPDGYEPYVSDRDLASDDRVEALGRTERNASIEQPTVAAPD